VIDNGLGIREQDKAKLFKIFGFSTGHSNKISTQGIGLGLVISKLIVQRFRGLIGFVSQLGKGSSFYFTFDIKAISPQELQKHRQAQIKPKADDSSHAVFQRELQEFDAHSDVEQVEIMELGGPEYDNIPGAKKARPLNITTILSDFQQLKRFQNNRILVADDEEFCISSMKAILHGCGIDKVYQVDYCINGQEYVDMIKFAYENGFRYKVVFTDFNMPGKDGIKATREVR